MTPLRPKTNPRPTGWHPLTQAGDWRLERQIIDHRAGIEGKLTGQCLITRASETCLDWFEEGKLVLGNHQGDAYRHYRIELGTNGQACVQFDDCRPFFSLAPDLNVETPVLISHLCGHDQYDGELMLNTEDRWQLYWRISGPRKALEICSVYYRS